MNNKKLPNLRLKVMNIRLFSVEDAQAVSLLIRTNLTEVNSKDYPPEIITSMCAKFSPEGVIANAQKRDMFVLEDEGKIVGTASLDNDAVYTVFVDVSVHKKGVGSALMDFIEKKAQSNGVEELSVPASLTATDFYQKRGYVKVKEMFTEEAGTCIIMCKHL